MDSIVYVYLITIFVVLIFTSIILCNKQKEQPPAAVSSEGTQEEIKTTDNDSKAGPITGNQSSFVTADILQLKEKSTAKNSRLISASVAYDGTKSAQTKDNSILAKENSTQAKDKSMQTKDKLVKAKDKSPKGQEKSVQIKEKSAKSQREGSTRAAKKKIVMRPGDPGMTAPIKTK